MELIEKEQITYRCPYCRKLYVVKAAAEKHLEFCPKNPKNDHACLKYCPYLERTRESTDDGPYYNIEGTVFTCTKTGDTMWSYIAERRGLIDKGVVCADTRMPLVCKHNDVPF